MLARLTAILVALAAFAAGLASADTGPKPVPGETRPVVLVGNNWEGTTDILDPYTFERLDRVNVIPDRAEREAEINSNPDRLGYFLAIRELVGEGHDQFNDDVFSSHDGRMIFVSRPSFADVVGIDLATRQIAWRAPVAGYRSDHMAISPDGRKLLVSASTGNVVHQIDTATGQVTGEFPSGDSPHESNYSADGSLIYHASIGRVYTPTDRGPLEGDSSKGARVFQLVDANTLEIEKTLDMGQKLEEAGYPDMSSAVRPMALAPGERFLYFQVSFFHGFVEYDLAADRVTRIANLPVSEEAAKLQREEYLLDSAHHGLAINEAGTKLCVAGTMSDYGAIVDRETFSARVLDAGKKPYWATNSADGRSCYMSSSGDDHLAVISYDSEKVLAKVPVGDHPQRVRNGVVRLDQYPGGPYGETFRLGVVRGRGENFGCRAEGAKALRVTRCLVRVTARRGGRRVLVGIGEKVASDRRGFVVDVKLTPAGRKLLRRSRRLPVVVTARGTDSVGRSQTARRRAVLRGAR